MAALCAPFGAVIVLVFAGALSAGCEPAPLPIEPPRPSFAFFRSEVYPELATRCASANCHGSEGRYFQLLAPGRQRAEGTSRYAPCTCEEACVSYERARGMLSPSDPERSLLLLKPLAIGAGGAAHRGVDAYGRDVYADQEDPGWQLLLRWVTEEPEDSEDLCAQADPCEADPCPCGAGLCPPGMM